MLHIPKELDYAQDNAGQDATSQHKKNTTQFDDGQLVAIHLVCGFASDIVLLPPLVLQLVELALLTQLQNGDTEVGPIVSACSGWEKIS